MDDQKFPWKDILASLHIQESPSTHQTIADFKSTLADKHLACPTCDATLDQLSLFYFISPGHTWQNLCGRAGWMVACIPCQQQIYYANEVMS